RTLVSALCPQLSCPRRNDAGARPLARSYDDLPVCTACFIARVTEESARVLRQTSPRPDSPAIASPPSRQPSQSGYRAGLQRSSAAKSPAACLYQSLERCSDRAATLLFHR